MLMDEQVGEESGVDLAQAWVTTEGAVSRAGVWHKAQPTMLNTRLPLAMESAPPGLVVDGVGGASRRMANCTTSLGTAVYCVGFMLVPSSGVEFSLQFAGRPPFHRGWRARSGRVRW